MLAVEQTFPPKNNKSNGIFFVQSTILQPVLKTQLAKRLRDLIKGFCLVSKTKETTFY